MTGDKATGVDEEISPLFYLQVVAMKRKLIFIQ